MSEVLASRNPPQLWRARVTDSVQMSPLLDSLVVQPLLHMFDHSTKEKVSVNEVLEKTSVNQCPHYVVA